MQSAWADVKLDWFNDWTTSKAICWCYSQHQPFLASRNWLHFQLQHLLSRLIAFNLNIAPSLKVKECWSNVALAAYDKRRAFRNLGLWCDLWLGSLVCSIWSFIDLRSFSRGLGKIRHSERSRKTKQRVLCFVFSTDFRGKTKPRNVKKIQPQKLPRSFYFSRLVKYGNLRWISPPLGHLGVKSKGCQEIPVFIAIITISSQFFFNRNVIEQRWSENNHSVTNTLVNAKVAEQLL